MSRRIDYSGPLFYYDGIQIFEGRDSIGGHYLGILVDEPEGSDPLYAIVGVPPGQLQAFRLGRVDLLSLIVERAADGWMLGALNEDAKGNFVLGEVQAGEIPQRFLPEPGFVLNFAADVDPAEVVTESVARNTLVFEVSVESLIPAEEHRIRAVALGGLLIHLQSLVKNAYRRSRILAGNMTKRVEDGLAPIFDVAVAAKPGSFKMILVPAQTPGLFGNYDVSAGLDILDYLLANASDPAATLERVQQYTGHTASSLVRLLRFIVETELSIKYAWKTPDREAASVRMVSSNDALPLLAILSEKASLAVERVVVTGPLKKVDVGKGEWRVASIEDGREHSGKVRPGVSLSGLVTDKRYVFTCEEELEEVAGTGREIRTLYLASSPEALRV